MLDPAAPDLGHQGGGHLVALDAAPDHLAVVAAGDDAPARGVDGGGQHRAVVRLDGDETALPVFMGALESHRAVAQGEGGATGAVEQGGGDIGVEGIDHARAIPRPVAGA